MGLAGRGDPLNAVAVNLRVSDRRVRLGLLVLLAGLLVASCATREVYHSPPSSRVSASNAFAHRLMTPEIEIRWSCVRSGQAVLNVNGIARNADGNELRPLGLGISGVDSTNTLRSAEAVPLSLHRREFVPFHLQLPIDRAEAKIDLTYQPFIEAPASQPTPLTPPEGVSTAQDICSKGQYPAG